MLEFAQLKELGKQLAQAEAGALVAYSFNDQQFSYAQLEETFRDELNQLGGDYNSFRRNQNSIFELIEQMIDIKLPIKVREQYAMFAEVKTFNQGDKPIFVQRITNEAKRRAKKFVTKVGLAGVYEVFKLDGRSLEIPVTAYGGAAQIGFEEFLDGRVTMADVYDIVLEGLDEAIYREIEKALTASIESLPASHKETETSFSEIAMDRLLSVIDSYGKSAIYCTYEFAATMIPAEGWASERMKDDRWNNGYLGNYKGHDVIVLRQSYEDNETTGAIDAVKVMDPSIAYIIPVGAEKPVKIAFEGQTIVERYKNRDYSQEIQTYKKFGVGTIIGHEMGVYKNSSLTR